MEAMIRNQHLENPAKTISKYNTNSKIYHVFKRTFDFREVILKMFGFYIYPINMTITAGWSWCALDPSKMQSVRFLEKHHAMLSKLL